MDPFMQLNYRYPGTSNVARIHLSQRPHGSFHRVPMPDIQSMQDQAHPAGGYVCPDPNGRAHAHSLLDFITSHDSYPQPKSILTGPQDATHPDSKRLTKICYTDEPVNFPDQYVPSSSDKITCTDHRPLDEIFGSVRHSSGLSPASSGLLQNPIPRGQSRQTSILTYALPTKPQLDGVIQIPLLAVDNQMSGTGLVVDFRYSDWGIGIQIEGIPMTDLLYNDVSGLENPHHPVLDGLGITYLRFNILWPYYPAFVKVISAFGVDGRPLTRAELGHEVSLVFAEFFYQITSHAIPPTHPGPYTISSSPAGLSSLGIEFKQLRLVTVRNTSHGEWMAEIRAVSMP